MSQNNDLVDAMRIAMSNARHFERELWAAKLEAELFETDTASTVDEKAYRDGWNERARSMIRQLRGGS